MLNLVIELDGLGVGSGIEQAGWLTRRHGEKQGRGGGLDCGYVAVGEYESAVEYCDDCAEWSGAWS
jgi:hypothetical protein